MGVIVGTKHQEGANKAIKALLAHCKQTSKVNSADKKQTKKAAAAAAGKEEQEDASDSDAVYLIVNTEKPLLKKNDYTPRIIKLPHKFGKVRSHSMLLITKDPVAPFRQLLEAPDSETEDLFKGIYGLKKLQAHMRSPRYAKRIFSEYDIILADHRVHHRLHEVLGARFYSKNRRVPFMVQMDTPERMEEARVAANRALRTRKKEKYPGGETIAGRGTNGDGGGSGNGGSEASAAAAAAGSCNPGYVYRQVKLIVRNTYIVGNDSGTTVAVKVGHVAMGSKALMENVEAVMVFLTSAQHRPAGGLVSMAGTSAAAGAASANCGNRVRSVHVKTSESASVPVVVEEEGEEDREKESFSSATDNY